MADTVSFSEFLKKEDDRDTAFFELANAQIVRFNVGGKSRYVDIVQNTALHDCCGGVIWETAYCLTQFLQKTLAQKMCKGLESVTVLETGAGCGLLGIVLACMGCSVILTDVDQALPLIHENVTKNASKFSLKPQVLPLDWENEDQLSHVLQHGPFDVIVATDVVFNTKLVPPLVNCLKVLSNPKTFLWICLQERSVDAFNLFMESLKHFFQVKRLPIDDIEFADEECVLIELIPLVDKPLSDMKEKKSSRKASAISDGIDCANLKAKKKKNKSNKSDDKV